MHDCNTEPEHQSKQIFQPANNRRENSRVLIRVFGETWEIEFVQFNDEHGCAALQTHHFLLLAQMCYS